jgi:hypothetical protein
MGSLFYKTEIFCPTSKSVKHKTLAASKKTHTRIGETSGWSSDPFRNICEGTPHFPDDFMASYFDINSSCLDAPGGSAQEIDEKTRVYPKEVLLRVVCGEGRAGFNPMILKPGPEVGICVRTRRTLEDL